MSHEAWMQTLWFGGIAVVVIFVLVLVAYGLPWRRGGVFPTTEKDRERAKRKANAIAERKESSKRRLK